MKAPMEIAERRQGKVVIVAPAGRIDMANAEHFRTGLLSIIIAASEAGEAVVLDFSDVEYISSMGLGVLILAGKEAAARGNRIAVAALRPLVHEIFQISRFDKMIPCYGAVDEAVAAVAAAP
jgi:anti-anti-sigma factor